MKQLVTILLPLLVLTSCGTVESDDRDECAPAFKKLLCFTPPTTVTEIRHGYFYLRDADAHWMTFTNDPNALKTLANHDMELRLATQDREKHKEIVAYFKKESPNRPEWFLTPDEETGTIYYKEDYLDHTFSEFFLWIDEKTDKVFLHVHYFD